MTTRQDAPAPAKKPTGGRPLPKRLFSFDSLRKERSGSESDHQSDMSNSSIIAPRLIEQSILEVGEDPFADLGAWTEKGVVSSPEAKEDSDPFSSFSTPKAKPTPLDLGSPKHRALQELSDDVSSLQSSPRKRWDTIRTHVIPSSSNRSETPPLPDSGRDLQPPLSSALPSAPARPSTPKGYRFGQKRAMRQVVVEAKADSDNRKLQEDIKRACWTVRFGQIPAAPKPERDPSQGTVGSSLHLPFMSSVTTLPLSASASVTSIPITGRAPGLRRPPSVQSLALNGHLAASVTQIARALTSMSSISRPHVLPLESQVLSALLVPFVAPRAGTNIEAEQATAVETFEYAVELERCLWCCKAAAIPSRSRMRILGTLSSILFSREKNFSVDTPVLLQTLLQAIFSLITTLSMQGNANDEITSLKGYVTAIRDGSCGPLDAFSVEREYGVRYSKKENEDSLRDAIISESAVKCTELGSEQKRCWVLCNLLEEQWHEPEPNLHLTPLLTCIHWRKLRTFIGSTHSLLASPHHSSEIDGQIIIRLFRSRILPEVEAMRTDDAAEIQTSVIRLVLELLCIKESDERDYLLMHFCDWYQNKKIWKESIEASFSRLIKDGEWPDILRIVPAVTQEIPDEVQMPIISCVMPLLYERVVSDPPELPCPPLSGFLIAVSKAYPKAFYKPLFTCAASSKDTTVVNQVCILSALAKLVPDFWTRDPEMVSVALMSDATISVKGKSTAGKVSWGTPRVGQSILLVELINFVRSVRQSRDMTATVNAVKFVTVLENRLGIIIEAKEKSILVPESQRLLFCSLLREIRLLTKSLKPATWLPSVLSWCSKWEDQNDSLTVHSSASPRSLENIVVSLHKLIALYVQAQESVKPQKKRATLLSSPILDRQMSSQSTNGTNTPAPSNLSSFAERIDFLTSTSRMLKSAALELLVSICGLLTPDNYNRLIPVLWNQCMDEQEARVIAPACFLVMQCGEKAPDDLLRLIEEDLLSVDSQTRRRALHRIGTLSSWRFQLLSQEVILDRSHRRPFKLARPPILFVATDIGSSLFVYEEDPDEYKDSTGQLLPLELRRRLNEIGWGEESKHVDEHTQWVRTPMSLLPSQQLGRLDQNSDDNGYESRSPSPSPSPSPEPSPTKAKSGDGGLARKESNSGRSQGVKRRPVFATPLLSLFPRLASMVADRDFVVASSALDLIVDLMRDDPSMLSRGVFNLLTGDEEGLLTAVSTLRAFLHVKHVLPPAMSHHILNHLTGFLKASVRHAEGSIHLRSYAYSIPIIANLVTQVSKLSMRELRRAKIDMFMIPTGALWFSSTAPSGPLFPRGLAKSRDPFETLPADVVWITLIRTSQNNLFLKMLKRNPQDIKAIRKNMTRLVLPTLYDKDSPMPVTLLDMLPRKPGTGSNVSSLDDPTIHVLSATLARSYLLLISQVFQATSRHLNDRAELAVLMDGINRILVVHGKDIGIVAHTMIALMIASTRFKRLFTSGGGYMLFMPALMKVYVESAQHPGIRAAIEYATSRFYALHQESFVFQTLDAMANVIALPNADEVWIAEGIFALLSTLSNERQSTAIDVAGIHGANRAQEREALMITVADEIPQTFIQSLTRSNSREKAQVTVPVPEEYENKRLAMDDLVRLFLTVIAHNPMIQRAENFLRFLRVLAPHLYNASTTSRTVLREGITAIGNILLVKTASRGKVPEAAQIQPTDNFSYEIFSEDNVQSHSHSSAAPSDLLSMRFDYLLLVAAFAKAGGFFSNAASQRIMELVKAILKESRAGANRVSEFVAQYARSVLIREPPPHHKQVVSLLSDLAPIVKAYGISVDFSGVYDVVTELSQNTVFRNERSFARLAVHQYCRIGLEACEIAASENLMFAIPIRGSLLRLMHSAVPVVGADVMSELEAHLPTYQYLAGIVFPFALTLKTSADILAASQLADTWRRDAHSRAWVHLLNYVLIACQSMGETAKGHRRSSSSLTNNEPRKSLDNRVQDFTSAKAFAIAIQALKMIIIRAEDDISISLPGIWAQIGNILKQVLADGDAIFALKNSDHSEPPSPSISPRHGSLGESQQLGSYQFASSISTHSRRPLSPPRMVDYITWSLIQWLWLRRSPLMLQMRIFVQERVAILANELNNQNRSSGLPSPRTRPISSVFSKPRRSVIHSATSSAASTPRNSVHLGRSPSLPFVDISANLASTPHTPRRDPGRQAGYAISSPMTPSRRSSQEAGPKIVHLGPASVNPYSALGGSPRPLSPGGTTSHSQQRSGKNAVKEMMITSTALIQATYRRIRMVQHLMGYRELLPMGVDGLGFGYSSSMEDEAGDDPGVEVKWWTKRDALEHIVNETKELLEMFKEDEGECEGDEGIVMVDVEEAPHESTSSLLGH